MKIYRLSRIAILVLILIAINLGLYYHKELIQYVNISTIISEGLDGRLIPHRINQPDKLQAVLDDGIQSLEVDLLFRFDGQQGYFEIGHDETDASGVRIDQHLSILQPYELKKIWLDIKNVSNQNIDVIISELERLDSLYAIRTKAIIESGITSNSFQRISSRGFHISYYLPTNRIKNLLTVNDKDSLQMEANRLKVQLEGQSVSAISFDLALYPFVKNYLEAIIPDTLVYHTWNSIRLWEWNAIDELKNSDYFNDKRVKTIIYKYLGSG